MLPSPTAFLETVRANPANATLLERLPALGLSQCYLTAGCLFQTLWNHLSERPPQADIKDYDVFYFDEDLSWEAEDAVIRAAEALCADLGVSVEVRNQARVHLWFEKRFGSPYPRLQGTKDGIDRYLVACTCVGIDVASGELYVPYGLDELWQGRLRRNPFTPSPHRFAEKAESYRARWPWLTVEAAS